MKTQAALSLLRHGHMEWTVAASVISWLVVLAAAWSYLTLHGFATIDNSSSKVTRWPSTSRIERSSGHSSLLLFLHPKCPCSRATVRELDRVFTNVAKNDTQLIVVATVPAEASDKWIDTFTVNAARRLPNPTLFVDRNGEEAARFGAIVSGQLMMFDSAGRRMFAGGITPSRGHEGANPGEDGLTALLRDESNQPCDFPVFGCRLCLPEDAQSDCQVATVESVTELNP